MTPSLLNKKKRYGSSLKEIYLKMKNNIQAIKPVAGNVTVEKNRKLNPQMEENWWKL